MKILCHNGKREELTSVCFSNVLVLDVLRVVELSDNEVGDIGPIKVTENA